MWSALLVGLVGCMLLWAYRSGKQAQRATDTKQVLENTARAKKIRNGIGLDNAAQRLRDDWSR